MSPEILTEFARGRMEASERAGTERHVSSCPRCRAELIRLQGLLAAVRQAPVALPAAGFLEGVRHQVMLIQRSEREAATVSRLLKARPWWRRPWIPAAACAAMAAAVSAGFWSSLNDYREAPLPKPTLVTSSHPRNLPPPIHAPSPSTLAMPPALPEPPPTMAMKLPQEQEPTNDLSASPVLPPSESALPGPEVFLPPEPVVQEAETLPDHPASAITLPASTISSSPGASGKAWLATHQNPDGSWGEPVAEENIPSRLQIASLAVLAMTETHPPDPTCVSCLNLALTFLKVHQDAQGVLGPPCDKRVLVQAMGTAALASLSRLNPEARLPFRHATQALLKMRGREGWTKDGAQGIHAVATAWASLALAKAHAAGAQWTLPWEQQTAEGCRRLVDRRRGTAGLIRPGDEGTTGGWASTSAVAFELSQAGRKQEARDLLPVATEGALKAASSQETDLETLALLAIWSRRDSESFSPAVREPLRAAFLRWGRAPETAIHSRWDSLEGPAYAAAITTWLIALTE